MPQRKGSRVVIDFSDLSTLDRAVERLTRSRTYYAEGGQKRLKEIADDVKMIYIDPMVEQLRHYPPSSQPGTFAKYATPKQRRYYFWAVRHGLISADPVTGKYIRTTNLAAGWSATVSLTFGRRQIITLRVANAQVYEKFVQGVIGLGYSKASEINYQRPVQKFHTITGWKPAYQVIRNAYRLAEAHTREALIQWARDGLP